MTDDNDDGLAVGGAGDDTDAHGVEWPSGDSPAYAAGDADPFDPAVAAALDDADPLASFRERFDPPDGELYVDGNSLGPFSEAAGESLDRVREEWRDLGIRGWEEGEPDWFHFAEHLGELLAPVVGADPDEVIVANSTTTNVHTLVGTFLDTLPGTPAGPAPDADAPAILVDDLDFPTDHYAIRAQLRQRGVDPDEKLRTVGSRDDRTIHPADVETALATHDDVGIVFLPSVLYRSGQLFDVDRITAAAHDHDALVGFDLAHSVGVVPHDLAGAGVDFAVWCSYKYLNAGPGAIAGLYVAERHHGTTPALAGWWGNDKQTQFEMRQTFDPADDASAWQIGTVPVLSAAPIEGATETIREAGIDRVRQKSLALTDYLIALVDALPETFAVGTPRDPAARGGHVAVEHPEGRRLSRALRDRGVVVDFRPPNVVRVCPSPLYTRFEDVRAVADHLRELAETEAYREYEVDDGGVT
ncbi:kynureninase [Halobaculum sp. MBLA0143]|uniref:kynureninase n=1 Tax=Halobaculum sp. MBLA0143 TaxID=3079933 RepID=UPI003525FD67